MKAIPLDSKWAKRAKARKLLDCASESEELLQKIRPHLIGLSPEVSGFLLADLVGEWLSGFRDARNVRVETDEIRKVRQKMLVNLAKTSVALMNHYDEEFAKRGLTQ